MRRSTVVSQKGQVVLPKALRDAYRWPAGTRLLIRETAEGLLLTVARPFKTREARSIAGRTGYRGPTRSVEDMQAAIKLGITARHARG